MKKVMFSLFMFSSFSFGIELSEPKYFPYPQWSKMLERENINCGVESESEISPENETDYFFLQRLNRDLQNRFDNISDQTRHGKDDFWDMPNIAGSRPIRGECEEYAIAARLMLWEAGFTNTRLLVAEITHGFNSGGGHVVLLVDDKYIIDSRRARVTTLENSKNNYRYIAASNYGWCGGWSAVLSQ